MPGDAGDLALFGPVDRRLRRHTGPEPVRRYKRGIHPGAPPGPGPDGWRRRGGRDLLRRGGNGRHRQADSAQGPDYRRRPGGWKRDRPHPSASIPDVTRASLHGFIAQAIAPGSTVTDGLPAYLGMNGYVHDRQIQRRQEAGEHLLPRVHRVISLLKRWLLGTHQGAIRQGHLDDYLDEFTFRFNRRASKSRGKLFYRLAQQSLQTDPIPFATLVKPQPIVLSGVK